MLVTTERDDSQWEAGQECNNCAACEPQKFAADQGSMLRANLYKVTGRASPKEPHRYLAMQQDGVNHDVADNRIRDNGYK